MSFVRIRKENRKKIWWYSIAAVSDLSRAVYKQAVLLSEIVFCRKISRRADMYFISKAQRKMQSILRKQLLIVAFYFILLKLVVCLPLDDDLEQDPIMERRRTFFAKRRCSYSHHSCDTDGDCTPCGKECNTKTWTCSEFTGGSHRFLANTLDANDGGASNDEESCYQYAPCTQDQDCSECGMYCAVTKICKSPYQLPTK
eukprot:Seg974.5 transcript_id=Seg974.5/GoldUCD/mRNA.D3Y31 product="hypothetical protein" protein_id=Seg974.5/GoldUCD/D3Y31